MVLMLVVEKNKEKLKNCSYKHLLNPLFFTNITGINILVLIVNDCE